MSRKSFVVWFDEVDKEDIPLVGGKGANLGEMTQYGIPVPPGFIITAPGYYHFIRENELEKGIRRFLAHLNVEDPNSLNHASIEIKKMIMKANLPPDLVREILKGYHNLSLSPKNHSLSHKIHRVLEEALVAVRSSATAEDLPTASFAGQQATFLNVAGDVELLHKVKACYASLFEARAIFYRHENAFDHFRVGIAVPVQKMVQADVSGVMFTIDPVSNDKNKIVVEAIFGLGELIVQGTITPDHYEVEKKTLKITKKQIEKQTIMLAKRGKETKELAVAKTSQSKQKIGDKLIEEVAKFGRKIEHHYFFPQDIEWAVEDGKVYIIQTRPITTIKSQKSKVKSQNEDKLEIRNLKLEILLKGDPASPGIASGPARVILNSREINKIKSGDILVAPKTNPDYVPAMKKAVAIITDYGGRTSHAAIVSRELGIPAVVGTDNATKKIKTGLVVSVNGATGEVFKGAVARGRTTSIKIDMPQFRPHRKTATKLYVNLAQIDRVAETAQLDVDGVGLLRAEFMIAGIGIHPNKIIQDRKQNVFIKQLSENLRTFCEHFHPRPVVYRLSDLKTNEYRNLKGGTQFEPQEENPMIGFRGAYRFIKNPSTLKLEIDAVKKVRDEMGFKNLWVMIPYIRTVDELRRIKKLIHSFGLFQSASFKLWMMVEIPSNVILIEDFLKTGIDGVSIGSNDLTMLTLGTDRDNSELANVFSEKDPAVIASLEKVIKACRKHQVSSSICGQAPSTYPELVKQLVSFGITSISVNPDAVSDVREKIYETERDIWRK